MSERLQAQTPLLFNKCQNPLEIGNYLALGCGGVSFSHRNFDGNASEISTREKATMSNMWTSIDGHGRA